ncbi:MAG: hypothetical protein H0W71_07510 [Sphingomonas sp.]|nr:hypothetical protein [Sphingomonas sp.]
MRSLAALVSEELAIKVDPKVVAVAGAIAARYGEASRAVLFYGSCLRHKQLDGLMLDFYLIVSDYRSAYRKKWLEYGNALIPPNVFYFEHQGLVAKYAVLSESDFARLCGPATNHVSVWARFAQPARLAWAADVAAERRVAGAIAQAAPTLLAAAGTSDGEARLDRWRRAFALTYSAELRAERTGRAASVVDLEPERYERFSAPAMAAAKAMGGKISTRWRWRRLEGKGLSVIRLAKASLTFAGGPDYIAWKINRHAGTAIELKPWQRRFPLVAAISLLPRLLKSGAVR